VKGWRMPENCVCVTRPGVFGNPFTWSDVQYDRVASGMRSGVVAMFREWLKDGQHGHEDRRMNVLERLHELRGKDLACYCRPESPCHADVLLELANVEV